ncbi:hypothetical protein ACFXGT_28425 [Streptomyces sp. NPDC059352]|uniref:hypothetical protein n=1 Tax=Streptomyces sp. NPDC059352 TaxID=3346810 RepID=UPI0036D1A686
MSDNNEPSVEQAPGVAELEGLKDEYRRKNKALDAERQLNEQMVYENGLGQDYANEISRHTEENGRQVLDEVQRRIDAHCRHYGLTRDGSYSGNWASEE